MAVEATKYTKLTTTCGKCGSKLKFGETDLKSGKVVGRLGDCVYVNCPECQNTIIVKKSTDGSFEPYINFEY